MLIKKKPTSPDYRTELDLIKEHIVDVALFMAALWSPVTAFFSWNRTFDSGLTPAIIVHPAASLLLVAAYLFRKRLSLQFKACTIITLLIVSGLIAFYSYGPFPQGIPLLLTSLVLTTVLMTFRSGVIIIVLMVFMVFTRIELHMAGILPYTFDIKAFLNSYSTVVGIIAGIFLMGSIVFKSLTALHEFLYSTSEALDQKNSDLELSNKKLNLAQSTLRESEEKYRTIFESANDAIIYLDEDIIIECNATSKQLFSAETLEKRSILEFSPLLQPDGSFSREKYHTLAAQALKGRPQQFYWQHITGKGNLVDTDISLAKMLIAGKTYLLAVMRDISEKKKMEDQMIHAQKMEAVGTLASGLAHDLNNLLGGITGGVQLLERCISKKGYDEKEKLLSYTGIVSQSSQRAASLVARLMNIGRDTSIVFKPMDLNVSLNNVRMIAESSFPKSVDLNFTGLPEPAIINAEPSQIEQVLLNLCVNASHAMTVMRQPEEKRGGTLEVRIEHILSTDPD